MSDFFNQNPKSNFKHQKKMYQKVFNTKGMEDGDDYLDSSTPTISTINLNSDLANHNNTDFIKN